MASFVFLALSPGQAQEAIKAEPAHYKLAFENEYVQVVNVHYGPHEKSGMHAHMGGVVVNITGGHMRMTDEHGKVREVRSLPGEARWFPPFKHSVENLEDASTNSVYVGIKHYPEFFTQVENLLKPAGAALLFRVQGNNACQSADTTARAATRRP